MYIELVRRVIEEAIALHVETSNQTTDEVLQKIRDHIESTSREYRSDEPEIQYDDPLCRLGYLYMHAAANATLFERVLMESDDLRETLRSAGDKTLNVCSMGGGPGTELLGVAKYFLKSWRRTPPRKITFSVFDAVPEWADTWLPLSDAVEEELETSLAENGLDAPTIAANFYPCDVLDPNSFRNIASYLRRADVVVFNYIFSENKTRLEEAQLALQHLSGMTPADCTFVAIDRLEGIGPFTGDVVRIFESVFDVEIGYETLGGVLDGDEQTSEMGEMLLETLKWRPRVKFFTDMYRDPTVFWLAVRR